MNPEAFYAWDGDMDVEMEDGDLEAASEAYGGFSVGNALSGLWSNAKLGGGSLASALIFDQADATPASWQEPPMPPSVLQKRTAADMARPAPLVKAEPLAEPRLRCRAQAEYVPRHAGLAPPNVTFEVVEQPPIEVRTRTPKENRTFGVKVAVGGDYKGSGFTHVRVELRYAVGSDSPAQSILGGTKKISIGAKGRALFETLCMSEASTKHEEQEFCLEFFLCGKGKDAPLNVLSAPFYAYSHKKVLTRRKNLVLRALGKQAGPMTGGVEMCVVGTPFIKGPSMRVVFTTPHGNVELRHSDGALDRFSESVMFFTLPPYPRTLGTPYPSNDINVTVTVTNDGRNFSNKLSFLYVNPDNCRGNPMFV
mmetsp:Transcript_2432/g.8680  ORF Transcript_2432/g.8680 Transcript_2432/m.8680 type:complete len:366 (+) Transcript_2432:85-1182(+)